MSRRKVIAITVAVLIAGGGAAVWWGLSHTTFQTAAPGSAKVVRVNLALKNTEGDEIESDRLTPFWRAAKGMPADDASTEAAAQVTPATAADSAATAEESMDLQHIIAPVAVSIAITDPKAAARWLSGDSALAKIIESPLMKGLFLEVGRSARVRAEDLNIVDMRGPLLDRLQDELIQARAVTHWDRTQGKNGFVLAFRRDDAPVLSRAIPLVISATTTRRFKVPGLESDVLDCTLAAKRFLLFEKSGIVYVTRSLGALLNVLAQEDAAPAGRPHDAFALRIRMEAYLDSLLTVLAGTPEWHVDMTFNDEHPFGTLTTAPRKLLKGLSPTLSPGILAAVPADSVGAAGGSFTVPVKFSTEQWQALVSGDSTDVAAEPTGGIALVWDVSAEDRDKPAQVGIAIAAENAEAQQSDWKRYFRSSASTATCADNRILIAASHELLLTRMREACERRSRSVLSVLEARNEKSLPQLFVVGQPSLLLKEGFDLGTEPEFLPASADGEDQRTTETGSDAQWRVEYKAAVHQLRTRTQAEFDTLFPPLFYRGGMHGDRAVLTGEKL